MNDEVVVRMLGPTEGAVLDNKAAEVFDHPINERWCAEFFADPRHHLAVALEDGVVVGMASAVHYVHPDKPPELWVNEVGVASTHRGKGIGRALLRELFRHGRSLGCVDAWVLTDDTNEAAQRLYRSVGGVEPPKRPVMFAFLIEDSLAS